jgi:hypothetical protein
MENARFREPNLEEIIILVRRLRRSYCGSRRRN